MNILVRQNDQNLILNYTIVDDTGKAVDLTGSSVVFNVGNGTNLITNSPATIDDAVNGLVSYNFTAKDTLNSGNYKGEFVVTYDTGEVITYPRTGYILVTVQSGVDATVPDSTLSQIAVKQGDYDAKLDSILLQAGNITMSTMNEFTWTSSDGQLTYLMPPNANYDPYGKWFEVYVAGIPVSPDLIDRSTANQFTLKLDTTDIPANTEVIARWTEPIVPVTVGHHTTHEIGGSDEIDITQLAGYQDNVAAPLAETAPVINVKNSPYNAKGDGTTDDTSALQSALDDANTKGYSIFIPSGNYLISSKLKIYPNTQMFGVGKYLSVFTWNGTSGGVVIGTDALTSSSPDFVGYLKDFQVKYPYSLLSSTSIGIYVAMPSGEINGVFIDTDNQGSGTDTPVLGSKGLDLDGCANAMPPKVYVDVAGQFETGISVRCNHAQLISPSTAFTKHGIKIDQDSIASPQSPPYNININGSHGYAHTATMIDIVRAQNVFIFGGLNESGSGIYNLQTESTFNGFARVDSLSTTSGSRLNRLGGTVSYTNTQDNQSTFETPNGSNNAIQQRVEEEASQNSISTTEIVIAAPSQQLPVGPKGRFSIRFEGNGQVNTSGANIAYSLYRDTAPGTVGSAPNSTKAPDGGFTLTPPSINTQYAAIARHIDTTASPGYFYVTAKVSTGTATVYGVLEVEAY